MPGLHVEPPIQHFGEVQHSETSGYWGPRTASVDWCEPNYKYSNYIAEWWNTVSSLSIVMAGVFGLYNAIRYKYHLRFAVPSLFMILVGIGSILFHGTLQYGGQALDEISMVYAVSCYLFVVLEMEEKITRPWLAWTIAAYDIMFTTCYLLAPVGSKYFDVFVVIFIVGCVWVLIESIKLYQLTYDSRLRRLFWVGFTIYLAAFLFMWIPDNVACERVGWLHLHAWFHVCSSIAPYWWLTWATHCFYTRRYAERTGRLRTSDGQEMAAPEALRVAGRRGGVATQALSDLSARLGLMFGKREWLGKVGDAVGEPHLDVSRPSSPTSSSMSRRTSDASDPSMGHDSTGPEAVHAHVKNSDKETVPARSSPRISRMGSSPKSSVGARSRGGERAVEKAAVAEPPAGATAPSLPIPVPDLDWYGPRAPALLVIPFVSLEWKDGPQATP